MTVRLMSDNFLDPNVVSSSYVSSEQTAFPSSNLYVFQRRSKIWRSNGFWEITASNNTLVFTDDGSTPLTATITVDNYTSTTLLFAEIKTQMETVGANTYTISQDANTSKIKIASSGGTFTLVWTSSTIGTALGFDVVTDDTGATTYTADLLKINTSEWLKWDFGLSTNPKAFILIGDRNKPIKISPNATIKLQGNETDVWTSPSYEQTLTYNDAVISVFDSTGLHTEALRYWRLEILDISNPLGYIQIGSLFLGDFLIQTRGAVQFPFTSQFIDRSTTVFSEGGQSFSDIRQITEQFNLSWFGLTYSEKEDIESLFSTYKTASPFFISVDPNGVFSSSSNYYIRYVKFDSPPQFTLESPNNFSCNIQLREEL